MSATPPPISPHALSKSLSWSAQYPSYQVDFVAQNTGRRVALTKRRVRWRFGFPSAEALEGGKTGIEARGEEHEVSLVWSLTSGKKSVVFDNQEVHSSDSRASTFEFSWSRDNLHVYKITAHATGNGPSGRQYDLIVDGQSYFDMPKVFELGLPNLGRQRKRLDMNDGGQQGGVTMMETICPLGAKNAAEFTSIFREIVQRRIVEEGAEEMANFADYLTLMKRLVDCNFAQINERAKALFPSEEDEHNLALGR